MSDTLTPKERHVMEHATAWKRGRYRNYFHTSHGTDDYPICAELERRGLMRSRVYELDETSIRGASLVFYVTQHGFAALEAP